MRVFRPFALAFLAIVAASGARADPSPAQSASCVAALKARAEPVAQRVRQGETAAETQLLPIVTASFAFIGTAYKQGIRNPQADDMMKAAEKSQATLPPAELGKLQDRCQAQGEQLLAQANYFERQFVIHAAHARIDRLRKHPTSQPAS
jgi:hypothetical protein